jgi:uncharacterized membrane protein YgaE (UPF0421/DUF939 family)
MLSLNNKNPIQYSLSRVFDTFIGIVISVAVNYLIFPPNNLTQMHKSLNAISKNISNSIIDFICMGKNVDLNSLRNEVINSIKFFEAYKIEFNLQINESSEFSKMSKELESLRSILSHLKTIAELDPQCSLNPENVEKLRLLNLCDMKFGNYLENHQSIIFNYHVGRILEILPHLSYE